MMEFAERLLRWFDGNARDLPWRGETDPYRIWISEIMLQQTRAETVKRYYERFIDVFPTVYALAAAQEETVLKLWEGLGYYSRARNLMRAAKMIVSEFGGELPDTRNELLRLPGVGEYVSGAVASIAFGRCEPALDGNQARVLSRIWDTDEVVKTPAQFYGRAVPLVPQERPGDYNQALMGLGALICLPKKPQCHNCPVSQLCLAHLNGTQEQRPVKPEKRPQTRIPVQVALIWDEEGILMRRRTEGLLKGMWEFPNAEGAHTRGDLEERISEAGIEAKYIGVLPDFVHVFTHRIWSINGHRYRLKSVIPEADFIKIPWTEYEKLPVPSAFAPYSEYAIQLKRQIQTEV